MDYYFSAASDDAALAAKDLAAGPMPGSPGFDSVEAKDVLACPHLEQLVALATGEDHPTLVPELAVLWPVPPGPDEPFAFEPGPSIMRLPDVLRDRLAEVALTPDIAAAWAAEIWGLDADGAGPLAQRLIGLARAARDGNRVLYWWMET